MYYATAGNRTGGYNDIPLVEEIEYRVECDTFEAAVAVHVERQGMHDMEGPFEDIRDYADAKELRQLRDTGEVDYMPYFIRVEVPLLD